MTRGSTSRVHKYSSASADGLRLSPRYRRTVYAVFTAIWLTGVLWLIFHYFLTHQGDFGTEPHALEAWWLSLHGAAAFVSLWLGGVLWMSHARIGLTRPKRRFSGILLIAMFIFLAVTGYLLYYIGNEELRSWNRLAHWLVGAALIVPFLVHALTARVMRKSGTPAQR